MAYGVFVHRQDSIYDDSPAERYQFPRQYLAAASACVGDWIVYLEPRRAIAPRGFFAIAQVEDVVPDATHSGMFVAIIRPGTYLDFSTNVPFSDEDGPMERGLMNDRGGISGRKQLAVRTISPSDFDRIVRRGFGDFQPLLPRSGELEPTGFQEEQAPFTYEIERSRLSYLTTRVVRDRIFRRNVLKAYDERCAVTGLRLINGGGRAEVDAAHIRSVEANGPDIVSNGLALSGTAHWMFDRGLIALGDDREILISRHVNDPDAVRGIINRTGLAILPPHLTDRPNPQFLNWHRENCFKH